MDGVGLVLHDLKSDDFDAIRVSTLQSGSRCLS